MPPESVDFLLADFGRFRQVEPAMYPIAPVGVEAPADLPEFGHGERGHDGSFIVAKRRRRSGGKPGGSRSARRPPRERMADIGGSRPQKLGRAWGGERAGRNGKI